MDRTFLLILIAAALIISGMVCIGLFYILRWNKPLPINYVSETANGVMTDTITQIDSKIIKFDGAECTLLFWMYVHKMPPPAGTSDFEAAIPLVQIGRSTYVKSDNNVKIQQRLNNLCVFMTNNNVMLTLPCGNGSENCNANTVVYVKPETSYIPSGRWAQYAFTINTKTRRIVCYIDGEKVYESKDPYAASMNVGWPVAQQLVISSTPGFQGMISKVGMINKVLSVYEIRDEYIKGPVGSIGAKVVLPQYGTRSPIVKYE